MSPETRIRPRVGIPWRTSEEQRRQERTKLTHYFDAVAGAGADGQEIRLDQTPEELQRQLEGLDGFVLPGSPADVDPSRYGAAKHEKTNRVDPARDTTDIEILKHALSKHKPVLAICYGCQILNVHKGGTLIQDIPSERAARPNPTPHGQTDLEAHVKKGDQSHHARFVAGSRLADLSGGTGDEINSSHHQAVDQPGEGLRVTAQAEDGIVEGVELNSPVDWVVGVQWHPERIAERELSKRLFRDFVGAARGAAVQKA
jgi:putative glutamine amidotransferase